MESRHLLSSVAAGIENAHLQTGRGIVKTQDVAATACTKALDDKICIAGTAAEGGGRGLAQLRVCGRFAEP